VWDVALFGEQYVLKAFDKVFKGFYVEKSVFDGKPMVVIPEFANENHANVWKQYWIESFQDPQKVCNTCPTVDKLFAAIKEFRGPTG